MISDVRYNFGELETEDGILSTLAPHTTLRYFVDLDKLDGSHCRPVVNTAVPGPRCKELVASIGEVQLVNTIYFCTDYHNSSGNYIVDSDSNVLLDLFQQIGSLPLERIAIKRYHRPTDFGKTSLTSLPYRECLFAELCFGTNMSAFTGYNNPTVLNSIKNEDNITLLASRPALGVAPPLDHLELLNESILSIRPPGMGHVQTMMCGTCSNENAIKTAFMWYMGNRRGWTDITPDGEEMLTAAYNKPPGCPNISVLSFTGAFHGRSIGCLSITHSKPFNKVDIPVMQWPVAPFPLLKYPLEEHVRENREEEQRCLDQVRDLFDKSKVDQPIATVIIEPIQSEGGDRHASPEFFRELQAICIENGAAFIVDEVQTGLGGTGKIWAHEYWNLDTPPNLVTFAKKVQAAGYFAGEGMLPREAYRIYNTWMGEPSKLIVLKSVLKEIKKENLLQLVQETGEVLLSGLRELERLYPGLLHSARGLGTYCAISCKDTATRDKLKNSLLQKGVLVGPCGSDSIRFRPALVCQPKHVNVFLNMFEDVLKLQ